MKHLTRRGRRSVLNRKRDTSLSFTVSACKYQGSERSSGDGIRFYIHVFIQTLSSLSLTFNKRQKLTNRWVYPSFPFNRDYNNKGCFCASLNEGNTPSAQFSTSICVSTSEQQSHRTRVHFTHNIRLDSPEANNLHFMSSMRKAIIQTIKQCQTIN
jgi:hypothetical protein